MVATGEAPEQSFNVLNCAMAISEIWPYNYFVVVVVVLLV